jgi:hypothetical protein
MLLWNSLQIFEEGPYSEQSNHRVVPPNAIQSNKVAEREKSIQYPQNASTDQKARLENDIQG